MNLSREREQLRALERAGKLEKLLAPNDDGMPWADLCWLLQFPAFLGAGIHIARMGMAAAERKASPPDEDIAWLVVLVLVAAVLRFGYPLLRTRAQRVRLKVRRSGLLLPAAVVQCNDQFFAEGNEQWVPGTLLVSFDPQVLSEPERLAKASERLFALKHADRRTLPLAHAAIAWDLYHEMGPTRSLVVPPELSEGLKDCVMVTAMLPPKPLASGRMFTALAVRGDMSPEAVAVIPAAAVRDGQSVPRRGAAWTSA
ncbi:MAG TPA: hypothetical protein VFD82_16090 [Planctomycetota bacterium]|nr:hypothetical protein [Planctomycetota bacterium]